MLGSFIHSNFFSPSDNPLSPSEEPHSHCTDEKSQSDLCSRKDHPASSREYGLEEADGSPGEL